VTSAQEHPVAAVLQTGSSVVIPQVSDPWLQTIAQDDEHLRLLRGLGAVSYLVVPLHTHGRTLGTLTCATVDSGRSYEAADVALAEEVGRRAAQAVDNARLYEQAREAVRVRDDFLSVASHELKTPITSLTAALQILQRAADRGSLGDIAPERVRRMLDVVDSQAKRLVKLVNELLDVSRLSEGRLQLDLEDVDLADIVREVVERFREEIVLAQCTLDLDVPAHVVGWWDRSRLEQVVTNLLSNALKYGMGTEVRISVEADAAQARLVVADRGIGIAPEYLPHIFGRFERAVSAKEYSGVGLGLYIVREIVAALHGTVGVASERGSGATFTVELPLRAAELAPPDPEVNGAGSATSATR
jgi:signal transduction histidine kinase